MTQTKETPRLYTMQERAVAELSPKVYGKFGYPITFLHDHERELLAEYVLDNDPGNENAVNAINDEDFDTHLLGVDAYRIIFRNAPWLFSKHNFDEEHGN